MLHIVKALYTLRACYQALEPLYTVDALLKIASICLDGVIKSIQRYYCPFRDENGWSTRFIGNTANLISYFSSKASGDGQKLRVNSRQVSQKFISFFQMLDVLINQWNIHETVGP